MPQLIVKVTSGEHVHLLNFLQGMGGGGGIDLPAHSVQDTVLLVNLWSPGFAKEFLRTQQATLQLDFNESIRRENPKAHPLIAETELVLEGSAFLPAFQRQLFIWLQDAETPEAGYGNREQPGPTYGMMLPLSPFSIGVTPLSWQASQKRGARWLDLLSAENQAALEGVRPATRVARMQKMGALISKMQDCTTLAAWKAVFFEFDELLERCDASERRWYLGAVALSRSLASLGSEAEKMQRDDILRHAYPDYAMCFFGNGSHARLALIQDN